MWVTIKTSTHLIVLSESLIKTQVTNCLQRKRHEAACRSVGMAIHGHRQTRQNTDFKKKELNGFWNNSSHPPWIVVVNCDREASAAVWKEVWIWARATWRINSFSPTSKTMISRWRKQLNCLKYEARVHKLLHTFPRWDTDWSRCCTSSPVSGVHYAQEFWLFLNLMFLTRMPCLCPVP